MKKTLLAFSAFAMAFAAQSQIVTGHFVSYDNTATVNDASCMLNFPNTGYYAFADGNVGSVPQFDATKTTFLTVKSKSTNLKPNLAPGIFDIPSLNLAAPGGAAADECESMRKTADPSNGFLTKFIDMSLTENQKVSITASSVRDKDTVDFFLFSSPDGGYPSTSTANFSGPGIVKELVLSTTMQTYTIDFTVTQPWETTPFSSWSGKSQVNGYGLRFRAGAAPGGVASEIRIKDIGFGAKAVTTGILNNSISNASAISVYPNPASDMVTVSYPSLAGKNVTVSVSNGVNTVATVAGGSTSTELNLSNLASGLYLVTVSADGAYVNTSKVFVK
jgi:hypothetical protein